MTYTDETIQALARLRQVAAEGKIGMFARIAADLDTLDNAGVFSALDEQTDYASAEEILVESARMTLDKELGRLDPAEWGDTTRADVAAGHAHDPRICTAEVSDGPSLHSGTCPVWAAHHNLTDEWSARARAIESIRPTGRTPRD